ncbi:hypothetical protein [Streptomyces sp. NPDC001774]
MSFNPPVDALLRTHQAIRIAITSVSDSTGTDPDRASLSIAFHAARDQIIQDSTIDLVGAIGRAVLDQSMPRRRLRASP